ncbi:MAG: holo-[acyl-carrier-protein] synthase [SAR202 cluster bacterium]|nr:holo-[acyl-carrier-protein] synthase [Chloroflexota bacterium]MQG39680.1 holo-[acyl-carrier-protein] synthase [SAR202 cluster bacterium]|tara:strand:- start:95 stop:466 length:372 start_codon:yes stop_codon:yes gene_type:complete
MLVTGVDVIEIERISRILDQYKSRFLNKIYTPRELIYCNNRANQLSTRFAAKEAVMKALGTGTTVNWKDIEVTRNPGEAPQILLHGKAKMHAAKNNITNLSVSLSHSREFAIAVVVGEIHKQA